MASWEQQTSPLVKFENSPAESFMSAPGDTYSSLFAVAASPEESTMNPLEIMTPRSYADDGADASAVAGLAAGMESTPSTPSTPCADSKKQPKKRKSWGQVLPEPKTNLPPRKRAKTEDEKEQRRVERVLRNRRAAQSSRERKRLEVEALEIQNRELQTQLDNARKANLLLFEELNKVRRNSGVVSRSSNPVTLSLELFSSQDGHAAQSLMGELILPTASSATVNPASLSPELAPVPDADSPEDGADDDQDASEDAITATTSTDSTQHPAAMLCDLPCRSAEVPRSWQASQSQPLAALLFALQLETLMTTSSMMLSVCRRPLTQIAMSLKVGFSLRPTPSILNTIIWLVTLPASFRTRPLTTSSTLENTSTTTDTAASRQTRLRQAARPTQRIRNPASTYSALRLKSLQKILTCSPTLARPLMDATMGLLRLVQSEGCDVRAEGSTAESPVTREGVPPPPEWLHGTPLPSKELLLTLLWTLRVEEGKRTRRELELTGSAAVPKLGTSSINAPTSNYILRVAPTKRKLGDESTGLGAKRTRLD